MKFPLRVKCNLAQFSISGIAFTRMDDTEKLQFLGITSASYNEDGLLCSFSAPVGMMRSPIHGNPTILAHFNSSNFLANIESREEAQNLKMAIAVHSLNSTSVAIGFTGQNMYGGCSFHEPHTVNSFPAINLDHNGIKDAGNDIRKNCWSKK